jgi:predicted small secreted protein
MKKSILALVALAFLTSTFLSSCNTSAEKVENAQQDLKEANKDLDKANQEYLAEVAAYKKEAADKIATNEKSIAEFKARKASEKQEAQADYEKKIDALEQKNSDMKKQMDDYQIEGREKWETFKTNFSHGMDELGKSFTGLADKNNK